MRTPSGFSLIELIITASIVGVLLAVAAVQIDPSRTALSQASSVLAQEITRTRFQSIRSNRMAELQISTEDRGSYSLCVDENDDQDCTSDEIITTRAFGTSDFPRTRLASTTLSNNRIRFDLRGVPTESLLNSTITLETENGRHTKVLTLSTVGRVSVE